MSKVKYTSNRREVKQRMDNANKVMLEAIGRATVGYVKAVTPVGQYSSGRVGGALRDSIDHNVVDDKEVYIGSTLISEDYPIYVHEGTYKMAAQPYIRDGVMNNLLALRAIAQRNYKL